MKQSNFKPPYVPRPGKRDRVSSHLRATNGRAGVYIIKKKGGRKPLYIGHSKSNLYKTILRHFQSWDDRSQVRVTYPKKGYTVRVVLTPKNRAEALERALIIKHRPQDNPSKLELYTSEDMTPGESNALNDYNEAEKMPF